MPGTLGPHAGGPGRGLGLWAQTPIIRGPVQANLIALPFDWGTPEGPQPILQSWTLNLLQTTLRPPPPPGIKLFDLPPFGYQYPSQLRTWTQNLLQTTLAPVVISYLPRPFDWGTPEGPEYPVSLRTWTTRNFLGLIVTVFPPGEQFTDRPPLGYIYQTDLRTWTRGYNLNLIGKDAMLVGDQLYDRPQIRNPFEIPHDWINFPSLALIAPFPPPDTILMGQAQL